MAKHAAPRRRAARRSPFAWLRSARVRAALSLGVVLGFGSVSTFAYWTDQATVHGGTFTAGNLDIKVGDPSVDNDPPAFTTDFAMSNMVPGNTKDASLKVSNAGSVAFTYTVTASATNAGAGADQLGAAIRLTVYAGACGGTAVATNVAPSALNISRPAMAANGSETLCFRATLPSDANTALQGKTTQITLTLLATQVTP